MQLDGRISESGTYQDLAGDVNSRFRKLMAAQLEAVVPANQAIPVSPPYGAENTTATTEQPQFEGR